MYIFDLFWNLTERFDNTRSGRYFFAPLDIYLKHAVSCPVNLCTELDLELELPPTPKNRHHVWNWIWNWNSPPTPKKSQLRLELELELANLFVSAARPCMWARLFRV